MYPFTVISLQFTVFSTNHVELVAFLILFSLTVNRERLS